MNKKRQRRMNYLMNIILCLVALVSLTVCIFLLLKNYQLNFETTEALAQVEQIKEDTKDYIYTQSDVNSFVEEAVLNAQTTEARKLLDDVKPEKLVLAHMGGNEMWDEVEKYLVGLPVYLDLAFMLETIEQTQLLTMIRSHGADKILFASDSPWQDQRRYIDLLESFPLTEEEKAQILYKNASKLLKLS